MSVKKEEMKKDNDCIYRRKSVCYLRKNLLG